MLCKVCAFWYVDECPSMRIEPTRRDQAIVEQNF